MVSGGNSARVRSLMNENGLNKLIEDEINKYKVKLDELKKKGADTSVTKAPKAPKALKEDATDADKEKYESDMKKYTEDKSKYDTYTKYKSADYLKLEDRYKVCKYLDKLAASLGELDKLKGAGKDKLTSYKKLEEDIAEIKLLLSDKPRGKRSGEDDGKYKRYTAAYVPTKYGEAVKSLTTLNMDKKEDVEALSALIQQKVPGVSLFYGKDNAAKNRMRFNKQAFSLVYFAGTSFIEELIRFIVLNNGGRKKLSSAGLLSDGHRDLTYYSLFMNLPHWRALLRREERRAKHNIASQAKLVELCKAEAVAAIKEGRKFVMPTDTQSFEDAEVEGGFAVKSTVKSNTTKGEKERTKYSWRELDDDVEGAKNLIFCVDQLCKEVNAEQTHVEPKDRFKFTAELKLLLAKIFHDFVSSLLPKCKLLADFKDNKTINVKLIETILQMELAPETFKGLIESFNSSDVPAKNGADEDI